MLFLIENVDMVELIDHLVKTIVSIIAYSCIQEFLANVCISCLLLLHSFMLGFELFHSL